MKTKSFDKYLYYTRSVQSPANDVVFMRKCYKDIKNKNAYIFREDFCFTFKLSCEWIKLGKLYKSIAIDINKTPLNYGIKNYVSQFSLKQKQQLQIIHSDVLKCDPPKADIICALNFSYFIFKKREELKKYFTHCLNSLNKHGILILDCFGGSLCSEANEEQIDHGDFIYYWDQKNFDPISYYAKFYIHYKRKDEKKRYRVFSYDWRLWTLPEIQELLKEVGFKKSYIYWEGTTKGGEGNGRFSCQKKGEECEAWIAYIIAE